MNCSTKTLASALGLLFSLMLCSLIPSKAHAGYLCLNGQEDSPETLLDCMTHEDWYKKTLKDFVTEERDCTISASRAREFVASFRRVKHYSHLRLPSCSVIAETVKLYYGSEPWWAPCNLANGKYSSRNHMERCVKSITSKFRNRRVTTRSTCTVLNYAKYGFLIVISFTLLLGLYSTVTKFSEIRDTIASIWERTKRKFWNFIVTVDLIYPRILLRRDAEAAQAHVRQFLIFVVNSNLNNDTLGSYKRIAWPIPPIGCEAAGFLITKSGYALVYWDHQGNSPDWNEISYFEGGQWKVRVLRTLKDGYCLTSGTLVTMKDKPDQPLKIPGMNACLIRLTPDELNSLELPKIKSSLPEIGSPVFSLRKSYFESYS